MNAYLVSLPSMKAVEQLISAMEAVGLWAKPWMGLLPFAYLAGDVHVVQVVCDDAEQLGDLIGDLDGATYLTLGTFQPGLPLIIPKERV